MMEMIESATMTLTILCRATTPCGNSGSENRINPYVPIFSSTPARMTEPAVGASVCASGNQVWNGNIGTLMAKAKKKPQKSQVLNVSEDCDTERSEEHTSELQSPCNLVCRLLLEKKNNISIRAYHGVRDTILTSH